MSINFRDVENKICVVYDGTPLDFPIGEKYYDANTLTCYARVDHNEGLVFHVIRVANFQNDSIVKVGDDSIVGIKIRADVLDGKSIHTREDETLKAAYAPIVAALKEYYKVDKDIEETRRFDFLDPLRHPFLPDEVRATILNEVGEKIEDVWVRLKKYHGALETGTDIFVAELLDAPTTSTFGYHRGDFIALTIIHSEDSLRSFVTPLFFQKTKED